MAYTKFTGWESTTLPKKLRAALANMEDGVQEGLDAAQAAQATADAALPKSGGTMSGPIDMGAQQITNIGTPTSGDHAATKAYVDAGDEACAAAAAEAKSVADDAAEVANAALPRSGGTMSGPINMGGSQITNVGDPSADQHAATKKYVDATTAGVASQLEGYLPTAGGTMAGPIGMGSNKITDLLAPQAESDAANKKYVDDVVLPVSTTASAAASTASSAATTALNAETKIDEHAADQSIHVPELEPDRVVVSDDNGMVETSPVTGTELSYVSGVTSSIQDQLDSLSSDISGLEQAIADGDLGNHPVYVSDDSEDSTSEIINADTLGGRPADEYATESYVVNKIAEAQHGYVSKDDVIDVLHGGTNATTPEEARASLGAAPNTYVNFAGAVNTYDEFLALLDTTFDSIPNNSEYRLFCDIHASTGAVPAGAWFVSVMREWDGYGVVEIVNDRYRMERKKYEGVWADWIYTHANAFAPAGYGLGNIAVKILSDKSGLDDLVESGFYTINMETGGFIVEDYWMMFGLLTVDAYNDKHCVQTLKSVQSDCMLQRLMLDGVWQDWEWLNPKLNEGIEYRTTERYKGQAVYIKLVNLGALPDSGIKDVAVLSASTNVIDFEITLYNGTTVVSKIPHFDTSGNINCAAAYSVAASSIRIITFVDMSGCTAVAKIKYTKDQEVLS